MSLQHIIEALNRFQSIEDEQQFDEMVQAVAMLHESPNPQATEALLHIFERFPEDDGYETFESILHVLEKTPGYELKLIESVLRQPSMFSITMINSILNGGTTKIGDTDLLSLLRLLEQGEGVSGRLKNQARDCIQRHQR